MSHKTCLTCQLFNKKCSGPTKAYPSQCQECRDLISRGGTRLICKWATQDSLRKVGLLQQRLRKGEGEDENETGLDWEGGMGSDGGTEAGIRSCASDEGQVGSAMSSKSMESGVSSEDSRVAVVGILPEKLEDLKKAKNAERGDQGDWQKVTEEHVGFILDLVEMDEDEETVVLLFEAQFPGLKVDEEIGGFIRAQIQDRKREVDEKEKAFI